MKGVGMLVGNFELNPRKETDLGVAQAFFENEKNIHMKYKFLYFFACNPKRDLHG